MAAQGKQGSIWKEKKRGPSSPSYSSSSSSSSPRHYRKPNPTFSPASKTKYVPKSQKNVNSSPAVKHRPGIVLLGTKSAPVSSSSSSSTSTMRYADIVKGSTPSLPKTEEAVIKRISDDKELFLPSDFPAISAEKTNRNRVKRINEAFHPSDLTSTAGASDEQRQRARDKEEEEMQKEVINEETSHHHQWVQENFNKELKSENQIDEDVKEDVNIEEKIKNIEEEQSVHEVDDHHRNEDETETETETKTKTEESCNQKEEVYSGHDYDQEQEQQQQHPAEDETEREKTEESYDHGQDQNQEQEYQKEDKTEIDESRNQPDDQEQQLHYQIEEESEEKFLKPTEILKLMKEQTAGKEVAQVPAIRQIIRCSNNSNNSNRAAVKKEAATTSAYNEVIEETASKLIAEEKRNKVLALVGAFETVISLENEGMNE